MRKIDIKKGVIAQNQGVRRNIVNAIRMEWDVLVYANV
jgi:hypothetical protein